MGALTQAFRELDEEWLALVRAVAPESAFQLRAQANQNNWDDGTTAVVAMVRRLSAVSSRLAIRVADSQRSCACGQRGRLARRAGASYSRRP